MLQRSSLLICQDLNKQNIEIISCGFSALDKTVPVNISILQPSFPSVSPQVYTTVIVRYESGLVSSVDVSWRTFQVRIIIVLYFESKCLNAHCIATIATRLS